METTVLLKQEINQTLESLHDFAKWKLIVTAALAATALRLTGDGTKLQPSWLLLLVPYACAYIDLNCYQYLIRITVISRGLRERGEDPLLKHYEDLCEKLRKTYGVFNLGKDAQVGVSLVSSISPLLAVYEFYKLRSGLALGVSIVVWIAGILLILGLWRYFNRLDKMASEGSVDVGQEKPKATAARK